MNASHKDHSKAVGLSGYKHIHKIAAIVLRAGKLLLVRKTGTDIFISPGGKPGRGESPLDTLDRELDEETGLRLISAEPFGQFKDRSAFENTTVVIDAYLTRVIGEPKPGNEIVELLWVGADWTARGIKVGSIFGHFVMPKLAHAGLLTAPSQTVSSQVKRIVFDLDETIIFNHQPVAPQIEVALIHLVKLKWDVIFATARAPRGVRRVLPSWAWNQPIICCNGALVQNKGTEIFRQPLGRNTVLALSDFLKSCGLAFILEFGDAFSLHGNETCFPFMLDPDATEYMAERIRGTLSELPLERVVKVSICHDGAIRQILKFVSKQLPNLTSYGYRGRYLDLCAANVDKHTAMAHLDPLGATKRSFVVFGNDDNDFELMAHSNQAFAVGSNLDTLRSALSYHPIAPEADAIAAAINTLAKGLVSDEITS